jgi:Rieske 2Fe-2S family protein
VGASRLFTPPAPWNSLERMTLSRGDLEAVLAPFADARPFPASAYVDPKVFAFEERVLFDRAWRCVGVASDVAHAGAWLRTPIGRDTLVVLRGEDLRFRAFYDACPHRGAPVFTGDRGETLRPACGYHGWAFDSLGALCEAPSLPRVRLAADRARLGLRHGKAAEREGLLFATGDSNAPDLSDATGEPPPWLQRAALATARLARRSRWAVAANWKLVVENFQESHHFVRVHPLLEARTPSALAHSFLPHASVNAWMGGIMPLADGVETVSFSRKRGGRPLLAAGQDSDKVHDALMFPLLLSSLQPDYLLLYRLHPLRVDETLVEHDLLVAPDAASTDLSDVTDFWARIHEEDRLVCEAQQRVLRGGGWAPLCYATCEDGVHAFDARVAAVLWEMAE